MIQGLAERVGLTAAQARALRRTVADYDQRLREGRHTYAGLCLQNQGLSPTVHARRVRHLQRRMTALIAVRDKHLLAALEPRQRQLYQALQGQPLPLNWEDYGFFYTPFCRDTPGQ